MKQTPDYAKCELHFNRRVVGWQNVTVTRESFMESCRMSDTSEKTLEAVWKMMVDETLDTNGWSEKELPEIGLDDVDVELPEIELDDTDIQEWVEEFVGRARMEEEAREKSEKEKKIEETKKKIAELEKELEEMEKE